MARTSAYSTILSSLRIPSSVFGAEYGDISNRLNLRDRSFEDLQRAEQLAEKERLDLEKDQRIADYERSLGSGFDTNRPKTMRDLYEMQLGKALETGNGDVATALQKSMLDYEENERKKKAEEFSKGLGLADVLSPAELVRRYPEVPLSEATRIFQERKIRRGGSEQDNRVFEMTKGGKYKAVRGVDEYNRLAEDGWTPKAGSGGGIFIDGGSNSADNEGGGLFSNLFGGGKTADAPAKAQKEAVKEAKDNAPGAGAEKTRTPGVWTGKEEVYEDPKTGRVWKWNKQKKAWE